MAPKTVKPAATQWSGWGKWIWSETYNRYYRQRQDNQGNIQTSWGPVYDTEGDDVPRQQNDDEAASLVDRMGDVQITGESSEDEEEYDGSDSGVEYHVSSSSHAEGSSKDKSRGHRRDKDRERSKDKGKEREKDKPKDKHKSKDKDRDKKSSRDKEKKEKEREREKKDKKGKRTQTYDESSSEEDEEGEGGYPQYGQDAQEPFSGYRGYNPSGQDYPRENQPPYYPTTVPYSEIDPLGELDGYDSDDHVQEVMRQSRQPTRTGDPSNLSEYPPSESIRPDTHHIAGGNEFAEELDPRYRIEQSHKFQPGEVFKVLWPEPSGQSDSKTSPASEKREVRDNYGGRIYVGFRRFVVIGNDHGHCTCVPIFTYGGQGCKKKGVKSEKHGIITQMGHKARLVPGEPKLGMPTVRVKMIAEGESLAWQSRINYSKLITVEHNVRVFFIGRIHDADYESVYDAVNLCWEQKTFHKKKR